MRLKIRQSQDKPTAVGRSERKITYLLFDWHLLGKTNPLAMLFFTSGSPARFYLPTPPSVICPSNSFAPPSQLSFFLSLRAAASCVFPQYYLATTICFSAGDEKGWTALTSHDIKIGCNIKQIWRTKVSTFNDWIYSLHCKKAMRTADMNSWGSG